MSLGDGLEFLFCAADDVDFRSVDSESLKMIRRSSSKAWGMFSVTLNTHKTNTRAYGASMSMQDLRNWWWLFTSTSDERNFALYVEEVTELEVSVVRLHLACCCRVSQARELSLEKLMSESLSNARFADVLSSRTE